MSAESDAWDAMRQAGRDADAASAAFLAERTREAWRRSCEANDAWDEACKVWHAAFLADAVASITRGTKVL
ncbi:hypothetical protein [Demequina capsici]|uniref:Uncharacterized protein n=1 Tax=Demequina capsici TaxID=3075620 RepID=A0AA96F8R3_9MICO|nr:hypothetical protein [Demequina sp. OYTSA14]WNM25253.1 hypothetical protein RN606_03640 [Demequina sp. OYTSA14]